MSEPSEIRYLFIRRPILAGVIAMVIVLLGAFALRTLPINRYPTITPPSVQVSAVYPGATAKTSRRPSRRQSSSSFLGWTACCTSSRRTPATAR
jgi:hypothetical protein